MKVLIGKTAGFCYGVQRAFEGAKEEIVNNKENVYCLGELVHNKQVIAQLEKLGIKFIDQLNEVKETNSEVIIRAHGVPNNIYDKAKKQGLEIKDFTCPKVMQVHKIAEEYAQNGYFILLCGKRNHPENIGTISYCGSNYYIIEDENDIEKSIDALKTSKLKKVLIIAQTTYNVRKFDNIENIIKEKIEKQVEIVIKNTICRATELRQKETEELSKQVDCMIVIGGKNSSNTTKLYEIAKKNCNSTFHIETVDELNIAEIKKYNNIGIMAGASTPKESIEEVIKSIKIEECMI